MKKIWLLFFIVGTPLSALDFNNFSDVPDRLTTCYEEFGYCHLTCLPNRSFFWSRPVYRNIGAQKPLWQEFVFNTCGTCKTAAFQVIPIYQQSFGTRSLAKYFLFNDQLHLLIKGDDVIANNPYSRDVRAEWIGLPSNYTGTFSVHPRQKQFGLWIEGIMQLGSCFDNDFFDCFWVGIAAPYQVIKNDVHPSQTPPINPSPTFPHDALEALSNPAYLFGKFDGEQERKSFAEIDFKFGTNLLNCDYFQIGMYSMFVVPLRGAARQEFVFNPFIGNNGHFGCGTGVTFKLPLLCDNECQLFSFFAYFENIYFFRSRQKRIFDLIERPWSRYLLLNSKEGGVNIPAINILTRQVRARPYNMLDMFTGFDWELGNIQVEIGYGLWARGREQLKFDDCFPANFGIAGVGFLSTTSAIPASASRSSIQEQAPNDVDRFGNPIFVPIRLEDLDIDSGAARGALSHRAHFSAGYIYSREGFEVLLGAGAFIEISQYNTAISNWGIWGKAGLSF
jgi:hypothetical protein